MKIKRGKSLTPNQPEDIHKKEPGKVTHRMIKEFKRVLVNTEKDTKNYYWYAVLQWSSSPSVTLEKRRIYVKNDGSITTGKACGFTLEDWIWMAQFQTEITEALQQ